MSSVGEWQNTQPYCNDGWTEGKVFVATARCQCGKVRLAVKDMPKDAKFCHCRVCQKIHGAAFQWAVLFEKGSVLFDPASLLYLDFYSHEISREGHHLPCKLRCKVCGTIIADDGRRMFLMMGTVFDWPTPKEFNPSCHIFYDARIVDVADALPKWSGHKGQSQQSQ